MTMTPTNYLETDAALMEIIKEAAGAAANVASGITRIQAGQNVLNGMAAKWLATVNYIDAQALANPADENWLDLKRRKDQIVIDFQAMKARAQAVAVAAIAANA